MSLTLYFKQFYEQMLQLRDLLKIQSKKSLLIGSGATCIALLLIRTIYYKIQRRIYSYPPGPTGIPIFGSMFSAINFPKYANYLYKNYGNTTMINIGSKRLVLLHSIDVINEVFNKKNIINRDYDNALHVPKGTKLYELNTVTISTKYWSQKRKIFQSIILSKLNSTFISDIHNYSLQTKIIKSINDSISNNTKWEPFNDIAYSQFNVIWFAAFGSALSYNDNERHQIMKYIEAVFNETALDMLLRSVSIFKYILPNFVINSIFKAVKQFDDFIESLIYKHCKNKDNGENYDKLIFDKKNKKWSKHFNQIIESDTDNVISKLIANYRNNPSKESTKKSIIGDIAVLFEAGVETTMNTAEFVLVLLAKSEKIQNKIYNQLFNVFGSDWKMEKIRFSNVSNELHLLRAFIYEAIRLSAVVPLGVGHIDFDRDIFIENAKDSKGNSIKCFVPKGTEFMANIPNANINDKYWMNKTNERSNEINLKLWLDSKGKFKANINKDKMCSFGVGQRDCAGKYLAIRSLSVIFAKWILLYKFSIDPNTEINQKFHFSMSLHPKIPITVQKR